MVLNTNTYFVFICNVIALFTFYALPSGGKSKGAVVHWDSNRGPRVGWMVQTNRIRTKMNKKRPGWADLFSRFEPRFHDNSSQSIVEYDLANILYLEFFCLSTANENKRNRAGDGPFKKNYARIQYRDGKLASRDLGRFLKKIGPSPASFCLFSFFSNTNFTE